MKLIQIIAQARHTAKRISDQSSEMAANNSFLSWFRVGSSELNGSFVGAEPEESGECLKKTHEFLDKALENLCQIFKVSVPEVQSNPRVSHHELSRSWRTNA